MLLMGKMWRFILLFCAAVVCLGAILPTLAGRSIAIFEPTPSIALQTVESDTIPFQQHFQELGIEGSILIYDQNQDKFYQHDPQRNTTAFLPASTFKIPNTLIALETGAIQNDLEILTWDGIDRGMAGWNQHHNLRTAFHNSTVWFYQVLARKIGHERMQNFVNQIAYGNGEIGDAQEIDTFWLSGDLRITPQEQIQFLRRLHQNDLPFSEQTLALTKDIMIAEQTPNYTLRAKTGWTGARIALGWYVGYLEQNNNVYYFATTIDMPTVDYAAARIEVTRRCLQDLGLL